MSNVQFHLGAKFIISIVANDGVRSNRKQKSDSERHSSKIVTVSFVSDFRNPRTFVEFEVRPKKKKKKKKKK